jgi:hypothetical protein
MKYSKTTAFFLYWLVVTLGPLAVLGEIREFTGTDGRTLEAELIEVRKDSQGTIIVELRRADRRYFTIPISRFSADDQKYFRKQWEKQIKDRSLLKAEHRISINLKLNAKTQDKDVDAYSYGSVRKDRRMLYRPEAVISNEELTQSFEGNRIRIVVIAQSKSEKEQFLIASATTKPLELPAKGSTSIVGQGFSLQEYEYKSGLSNYEYAYGYEKDDYVVLIYNRDGEITHSRSSSNKFMDHIENVEKCKAGEIYSEGLEHRIQSMGVSSSYFSSFD